MKVSVIGAGRVGGTLGSAFAVAGHEVSYGLRDPEGEHAALREHGTPRSIGDAAAWAEVVVLAVPFGAARDALESAGDLGGKPLIDATNPIGPGLTLLHAGDGSGAENVARWATNAKVVKAFNSTGYENMASPVYDDGPSVMPYCGDDEQACAMARTLVEAVGFEPLFVGPLTKARILEPFALVWITLAMQKPGGELNGLDGRGFAFRLIRR